jgi:hypothetical protein
MIGGVRTILLPNGTPYQRTHDYRGRCLLCGRKRSKQAKKPFVVAMTLQKGWRLIARPLSYRVQTLKIPVWQTNGNPVWTDVQRFPRTRNAWLDDEMMCAVSMLHTRVREWKAGIVPLPPEPKLTRAQKFMLKFLEWKDRL